MGYEFFNKQIKETCWLILEKYEKLYPNLADSLAECIQDRINEEHLATIRLYNFSNLLDEADRKALDNAMQWYYDYIITMVAEEAYYNSDEYKELQEYYDSKLRI